ncbi:MAG: DNA cytosine methyltransferase, partial [Deltaproteobacteria bacterium]|nr:DNA cytosine methyltransferase [Deltaproteobacteria bacterium]
MTANKDKKIRAIDLFCGVGGSSWGALKAGAEIIAGFDKWNLAGKVYKDNFPNAKFHGEDLNLIDPLDYKQEIGAVNLILASPECTNHSPAKGAVERCEKSRETAFYVTRFAEAFLPQWIIIENVVSMRRWKRYQEFLGTLRELGYHCREQVLDASDFNVPQGRRRLFIMCDRDASPPE